MAAGDVALSRTVPHPPSPPQIANRHGGGVRTDPSEASDGILKALGLERVQGSALAVGDAARRGLSPKGVPEALPSRTDLAV
jgi:hypothetical protein